MPDAPTVDNKLVDGLTVKPDAPSAPAKIKVGDRDMTPEEAAAEITRLREASFTLTQNSLTPEAYEKAIRTSLEVNGWDKNKIDSYLETIRSQITPDADSNAAAPGNDAPTAPTLDEQLAARIAGIEKQTTNTRAQLLEQMQGYALTAAMEDTAVKELIKAAKALNNGDEAHAAKVAAAVRGEASKGLLSILSQKVAAGFKIDQSLINEAAKEAVANRVSAYRSVIGSSPNIGRSPETAAMDAVLQSLDAGKLKVPEMKVTPDTHPAIAQDQFVDWATAMIVNAAIDANKQQARGGSLTTA